VIGPGSDGIAGADEAEAERGGIDGKAGQGARDAAVGRYHERRRWIGRTDRGEHHTSASDAIEITGPPSVLQVSTQTLGLASSQNCSGFVLPSSL
jgi:hypothetical protein